jgi:hypothetical protein
MKTSGSSFELIKQEVLKQKQLFEDLQTENDELHRQLVDLREGRGIFVEILGTRFPLTEEAVSVSPAAVSTTEVDPALQETTAIFSEALPSSLPETPLPTTELTVEEVPEEQPTIASSAMPDYLEEALLDEFSNASTSQMAVWSGPITNPPEFDEKEKEILRRELSGSFMLE